MIQVTNKDDIITVYLKDDNNKEVEIDLNRDAARKLAILLLQSLI